jgi:hydrogenase maturation protease
VNSGGGADELVKTLVVGMGNPILCDDSVGIRLARFVNNRIGHVPGVTVFEECSVGGLNILDVVAGYDRVIILDSIKTTMARPGYWYRFNTDSLKATMNLNNIHDVNIATALELGRRLGIALPDNRDIHVFAVEVLDNITFTEQMSEPLERHFLTYAEEICSEIAGILGLDEVK